SRANHLWGAPHIHGELLKLGFTIAQSTVARYMYRDWLPSQGWRTFLTNHVDGIAAIDLFKSDRGVDFAPDHRGVSLGQFTSLSYSGPGHCVWPDLQAAVA